MEIQKWYEELKQGMRQEGKLEAKLEGRLEGKLEGRLEVLADFFSTRLGRPLSEAEQAVLAERATRLRSERLRDVVLTFDGGTLAAWLADPAAS